MAEIKKPIRIDKAFERAAVRTVNELLRQARTQGTKKVRETYNIKARELKKATKTVKATTKFPLGYLEVKGKGLPLSLFGVRHLKRRAREPMRSYAERVPGATVEVIRGDRKPIKHSFLVRVASGARIAYIRKTKAAYPFTELYTIGASKMFSFQTPGIFNRLVQTKGPRLFRANLNFYLAKESFR